MESVSEEKKQKFFDFRDFPDTETILMACLGEVWDGERLLVKSTEQLNAFCHTTNIAVQYGVNEMTALFPSKTKMKIICGTIPLFTIDFSQAENDISIDYTPAGKTFFEGEEYNFGGNQNIPLELMDLLGCAVIAKKILSGEYPRIKRRKGAFCEIVQTKALGSGKIRIYENVPNKPYQIIPEDDGTYRIFKNTASKREFNLPDRLRPMPNKKPRRCSTTKTQKTCQMQTESR